VVLFELTNILLLIIIHNTNSKLLHRTGDKEAELPGVNFSIWYTLALPITQLIHFGATLSAAFAKQVSWRQIDYRINKSRIELLKYQPFVSETADKDLEQHSID